MISSDTHQPIGSCFVFKRGEQFPDVNAVNAWIEKDEYFKHKGELSLIRSHCIRFDDSFTSFFFFLKIKVWERRDISLFIASTDPWTPQK